MDHNEIERCIAHLDELGLSREANAMRYLMEQLRFARQGHPRPER